ncbi:hypothetical protein LguiB_004735 [Lonicera macranthoides]
MRTISSFEMQYPKIVERKITQEDIKEVDVVQKIVEEEIQESELKENKLEIVVKDEQEKGSDNLEEKSLIEIEVDSKDDNGKKDDERNIVNPQRPQREKREANLEEKDEQFSAMSSEELNKRVEEFIQSSVQFSHHQESIFYSKMGGSGKRSRSHQDYDWDWKNQKRRITDRDEKGKDELIAYRILCPDGVIGSVIGKSGKVINSIRQETGAKVKVVDPFPGAKDRVITIYSYINEKQDVDINDEFNDTEPLCPAQDALLKMHVVIANAVATFGDFDKKRNDRAECQLLVPFSQSANIIGRSGVIIKKLRSKTRANIKITGDSEAVKKALFAGYADKGTTLPVYSSAPQGGALRYEELIIRVLCPFSKIVRVIGKGGSSIKASFGSRKGNRFPYLSHGGGKALDDRKFIAVEALLLLQGKINDEDGDIVSIRLLIPYRVIGCIIGRSGSIINEIRKRSKADVSLSKGEIPKCADPNDELVEVHFCSVLIGGKIYPAGAKSNGYENRGMPPPPSTLEMVVPAHVVGKVMGRGAAVEILYDSKSFRGDHLALILGTSEQKRAAKNLIQAFIMAT